MIKKVTFDFFSITAISPSFVNNGVRILTCPSSFGFLWCVATLIISLNNGNDSLTTTPTFLMSSY
jgi:hypothetical protein